MEDKTRVDSIIQHLREYMETRWELFILDTSDKASDIISSAASILLIAISMLFVLLFLSIGAALWIGQSCGNTSTGFLYVGLFYLFVSLILFFFRHSFIKIPVLNKMLTAISSDEKNK